MTKFTPIVDRKNVKICIKCGKIYKRDKRIGNKTWEKQKSCSIKCRKGMPTWNKGLKGTQKANSGSFKKGEHRNLSTEFDGSYAKEKHWNWKGGITPINQSLRTSIEYKQWRTKVFRRDNYTCIWCGIRSGNGKKVILHADHIKSFAYFSELRFNVSNGRTLCEQCHKFTASYMGRLRRFNLTPKRFRPGIDRCEYGGAIVGPEEFDAIMGTILSQDGKRWTLGPQAEALEKELAELVGVKHAIVTNSGSSALLVALQALHLPPKSLIVIPALNFPTAFNAIIQTGNVPYVVDIDPKTMLIDLGEVKKAVGFEKIKAVIAVNVGSNPVDTVKLKSIVGNAFVISDNCDGLSTTIGGKFVEDYADVSCTSFHAAHIVTMGEGGAVMTNNKDIAERSIKLREWGRASGTDKIYNYPGLPEDYRERYVYEEIGYNMKPLELQCALGRVQLTRLMDFKKKRLNNFNLLYKQLSKMPKLRMVEWLPNSEICWFSFPFICEGVERKLVMETLEKNNIECRTIFSGNILRHPAYKDIAVFKHGEMPNADKVMFKGMFISVHPSITEEMIKFIVEVLKQIC